MIESCLQPTKRSLSHSQEAVSAQCSDFRDLILHPTCSSDGWYMSPQMCQFVVCDTQIVWNNVWEQILENICLQC